MSELFRIPRAISFDVKTESDSTSETPLAARLIFWALALLTLVMLALQFGAWHKEYSFTGPFDAELDPPRQSLVVTVPEQHIAWWKQPPNPDSSEKPFESRIELRINGHSMGPPHTQHAKIRAGGTEGFSHWGSRVIFALPPGVENVAATTATLRYSVQPRPWVTLALLAPTVLLGWLLYREPVRAFMADMPTRRRIERHAAMLLRATYLILFGLCGLGLIGAAMFVASSIHAYVAGWALPTTALVRWWPAAEWAASNEIYLPYLLLTLAGLGTLMIWLGGMGPAGQQQLARDELRLQKLLCWAGFPLAACAFAFSISGMWSGLVRPGDLDAATIGGLIPYNDAFGHLAAGFDQARDGTFDAFAMRRPLAAAFRSVLLFFSQYSLPNMLLVQVCLLGIAAWLASYAVMVWRGVWAGVAFFSLVYIYARIFAPTTLTEPLGLFWGLLSVPFFIDSFRSGSVKSALIGFAITTLALMTRMGNMFAIPALMLWLVWQFGEGIAAKARIGLLSIGILLGVFGLNSLLQKTYGAGNGSTGSNFSYTLCGLTLGTTWDGCPKKIEAMRAPDAPALSEEALGAKMYAMAWDNFRAHPEVLFDRLGSAVREFYNQFPETMWKGYATRVGEPGWFHRHALTLLMLIGLCFVALRQASSIELAFWALFWISLTASAAIVYFDDGNRVLAASQPLVALFLAIGLANPALKRHIVPHDRRLTSYGSSGLLLAAVALAMIPWISHRVYSASAEVPKALPTNAERVFVSGKLMTGFLVVADGEPLRTDLPTIHLSDFVNILEQSYIEEYYQGLLHPVAPPLPFGFVFAPRLENSINSYYQYIVPAEVMERRDVTAWRFKIEPWRHKTDVTGNVWVHVTDAQPWPLPAQ
jgi:hypothetical protein